MGFSTLELCAGAGGQAIGLERAGFACAAAVEIDPHACATLRANRPAWSVLEGDLRSFDARPYRGVELVAGGVPVLPFPWRASNSGATTNVICLFPEALRVIEEAQPTAVLLENVPVSPPRSSRTTAVGSSRACMPWATRRTAGCSTLPDSTFRNCVHASSSWPCGSAMQNGSSGRWPHPEPCETTVGRLLADLMGANNWPGCARWVGKADGIGPTIVGGSKNTAARADFRAAAPRGDDAAGTAWTDAAWAGSAVPGAGWPPGFLRGPESSNAYKWNVP